MPWRSRWLTWDAVFTLLGQYRSSPAFRRHFMVELGYLLPRKFGEPAELCLGSSFAWCDRISQYPNETSFQRLEYLEKNPLISVDTQQLHLDTRACMVSLRDEVDNYTEYFNILSRAAGIPLSFERAFGVHFPELDASMALLMTQIESSSVYCLAMRGYRADSPDQPADHVAAFSTRADNSARFFQNAEVEFHIEQDRLPQFLGDFLRFNRDSYDFYVITGYKVSRQSDPLTA